MKTNRTNVTPKPFIFVKGTQRPVVGAEYVCSAYNFTTNCTDDDVSIGRVMNIEPIDGTNICIVNSDQNNFLFLVQIEESRSTKPCYAAESAVIPVVRERYNCRVYNWVNYQEAYSVETSPVKDVKLIEGTNIYIVETQNSIYFVVAKNPPHTYVAIGSSVPVKGQRYICDVIDRVPNIVTEVSTSRVREVTVLDANNNVYRVETANNIYIVHVEGSNGNKPRYFFAKACACPTVGNRYTCYAFNRWNGESDITETSSIQAIERITGTDFYRVRTRNSVYLLRPYEDDETKPCFFASGSVVPEVGKRCVCNALGRFRPNVIEEVSTGAVISVELMSEDIYRVETENSIYVLTIR